MRSSVISTNLVKTIKIISSKALLAVSAAVLVAMMLLTAVDVGMRYILKLPIPGAFELAEYMMAAIVPLAIAYCAGQNGHVSVELLFKKMPNILQIIFQPLISIATFLFAALLTWQNFVYIGDIYRDRLVSSVLLIPVYPFIIPVAVGMGVYAAVILFGLFRFFPEERKK